MGLAVVMFTKSNGTVASAFTTYINPKSPIMRSLHFGGVQGEPSNSASLRGARAAQARALVFLGAAQRPMMAVSPPPPPPPQPKPFHGQSLLVY